MLMALTHLPSPLLQNCELTFLQSEPISLERANMQHAEYRAMLERCGVSVVALDESRELPDSVFC